MSNSIPADQRTCPSTGHDRYAISRKSPSVWDTLAASAVLVLGSPRSGTTWLAKIFDSHPDILYRHEPDEVTAPIAGTEPRAQLAEWIRQTRPRSAAKRPWFRKSWRPPALDAARRVMAATLALSQRLPLTARATAAIGLPDLVAPGAWPAVRAAVKLVNWDGSAAARALPDTRSLFMLRHPCGQIASVLAGSAARRFDPVSDATAFAAARTHAARQGIGTASFDALPDAAKHAWAWLAFNEPAVASIAVLANARTVIYEDLCRDPEAVSRGLFAFADLEWSAQTKAFLGLSTRHGHRDGYYDVFRNTREVADRWSQTMRPEDRDAVRTVVRASPLASLWPDLAGA